MRIVVSSLLMALASAQSPQRSAPAWELRPAGHALRTVAVPAVDRVALTLLWPQASMADAAAQKAFAAFAARCRAAAADAAVGARTEVEVIDGATMFHSLVPPAAAAEWIAAVTGPVAAAIGDELLARIAAQIALSADDAEWLYPGEILIGRARQSLRSGTVAGTPLRGDPAVLQRATAAERTAQADVPPGGPLRLVAVGCAFDLSDLDRCRAALDAVPVPAADPAATFVPHAVPAADTTHERADGTLVAAAVAVPQPSEPSIVFAVAIEVLRWRAFRRLPEVRAAEIQARAPQVGYSFLLGDTIAVLCRRGPDHAGAEPPRRDLEAVLQSGRDEPPTVDEIDAAVRGLQLEWLPPPWDAGHQALFAEQPEALRVRSRSLCLLGHWGIGDAAAAIAAPPAVAKVGSVLRAICGEDSLWWGRVDPARPAPPGL